MAEVEVLLERTMRQQQEQLGAHLALVRRETLHLYSASSLCALLSQVNLGMQKSAESQQAHSEHVQRYVQCL